jgi:EmrB/QacA subfamily drug resistance transporter
MTDRSRRSRIIAGAASASFLAALDTTVLATAMPTIVGELGGMTMYSWAFSVYMIMTAVSMPVWGKLVDTLGKKQVFFWTVAVFVLGSLLCGMAWDIGTLILFRGIQGVGAGGLAAVPFALISTVFPVEQRGKALGFLASTWGVASVLGPMVGSFLVLQLSWRWVFYVNIPFGILGVVLIALYYRDEDLHVRRKVDYVGSALLCSTIMALMMVALWIGKGLTPADPRVAAAILICGASAAGFLRHERKAENPVLELRFFRIRTFWLGNLLGFLASFAVYGVIAFMPLYAQTRMGGTPVQAGVVITAMSLSWSTASITAGRLVYRLGERTLVMVGGMFMIAGFLMVILGAAAGGMGYLVLCVAVLGLGMGCQTPSLMLAVQHSLEPKHLGVATSSQMLARSIGGALGVSVLGAAVAARMAERFAGLKESGGLGDLPLAVLDRIGEPQQLLSGSMRSLMTASQNLRVTETFAGAVEGAFVIGMVAAFLTAAGSLLLPGSSLHRLEDPKSPPASSDGLEL